MGIHCIYVSCINSIHRIFFDLIINGLFDALGIIIFIDGAEIRSLGSFSKVLK